jgi:hypothetical protein
LVRRRIQEITGRIVRSQKRGDFNEQLSIIAAPGGEPLVARLTGGLFKRLGKNCVGIGRRIIHQKLKRPQGSNEDGSSHIEKLKNK